MARLAAIYLVAMSGTLLLASDQFAATNVITKAAAVRSLSAEQADKHYLVRLRGVVTFFDMRLFCQIIQDETAGIYLPTNNLPPLSPGQLVEVQGRTSAGEYAPVVQVSNVTILGTGVFPQAKAVTYTELISGAEDSQFVEVEGIVRGVDFDEQTKYYSIVVQSGGGRLTVQAAQLPVERQQSLVDSTVRIRGVCVSRFNSQRQLFDIRLLVPRPADLVLESPAPEDPFATPARRIEQLLQFSPGESRGHRVKVLGTVIYRRDTDLYIQDENEGLYVQTWRSDPLVPGDQVEVLGFPAKGEYAPLLEDAIIRKIGWIPQPPAVSISADEALKGNYECRLVQIEATVLDRARQSREQILVLQSGGFIFDAFWEGKTNGVDLSYLKNGARVTVTGVCRIEMGKEWHAGADWRAKSFRILMRSPDDIFLLAEPPWWDLRRLLWALGILGVLGLTALAWVAILRRRVQQQTAIISRQLRAEAALKERYENLFENANDMVFTHDLTGNITSVNKVGEQLLGRSREQIIGRGVVEFVAEEQRDAVKQWLAGVATGAELPSADWDFVNAGAQRVRLEISARLMEQARREPEVESIARDITERKGLEREILEISNREQRRIGHDLHDGVCQQLAAIAYRLDILGDQLQAKGVVESSETERIGALLNDAVQQTRGVARGLFPVQLDESGLAPALEELADNVSSLFRIQCRFDGADPLPAADKSSALHLYYIAQEAVSNAIKHGKATDVTISLARAGDRLQLTILDNGSGFQLPAVGSAGMGLRIMRYRARMIGGTLEIKSQPKHGTQITCTVFAAG
jgi:PAS domain S-box-containing protein